MREAVGECRYVREVGQHYTKGHSLKAHISIDHFHLSLEELLNNGCSKCSYFIAL